MELRKIADDEERERGTDKRTSRNLGLLGAL